jgi:hypothetical protein
MTAENKLYDVLLTQYFRFKVAAPDLETAEELAKEDVLWDDHFSDLHFEFDINEHGDLETADSTYKPETEESSQ